MLARHILTLKHISILKNTNHAAIFNLKNKGIIFRPLHIFVIWYNADTMMQKN